MDESMLLELLDKRLPLRLDLDGWVVKDIIKQAAHTVYIHWSRIYEPSAREVAKQDRRIQSTRTIRGGPTW